MTDPRPWTDEEENARLIKLWGSGMSTKDIGKLLGRSSNSVLKRAHRMKLPLRQKPGATRGHTSRVGKPKPANHHKADPRRLKPIARVIDSEKINLPRGCLWPMWEFNDPVNHQYCGQRRVPKRPYCPEHCKRAYGGRPS